MLKPGRRAVSRSVGGIRILLELLAEHGSLSSWKLRPRFRRLEARRLAKPLKHPNFNRVEQNNRTIRELGIHPSSTTSADRGG
jgi:hypothetical protein